MKVCRILSYLSYAISGYLETEGSGWWWRGERAKRRSEHDTTILFKAFQLLHVITFLPRVAVCILGRE